MGSLTGNNNFTQPSLRESQPNFRQPGDMGRYIAFNDPGQPGAGFSNYQDYLNAGNKPVTNNLVAPSAAFGTNSLQPQDLRSIPEPLKTAPPQPMQLAPVQQPQVGGITTAIQLPSLMPQNPSGGGGLLQQPLYDYNNRRPLHQEYGINIGAPTTQMPLSPVGQPTQPAGGLSSLNQQPFGMNQQPDGGLKSLLDNYIGNYLNNYFKNALR